MHAHKYDSLYTCTVYGNTHRTRSYRPGRYINYYYGTLSGGERRAYSGDDGPWERIANTIRSVRTRGASGDELLKKVLGAK